MLALAADENFNNDIVRGLLRRKPDLNIVRLPPPSITHYAYERARAGKPMPGVFEVSRGVPIGQVIEDILLLAEYSLEGEWEGQVRYLPLR